ncbi:hypothetical protein BABINDRAFT_6074 [Babjeviella inositovora NRRL Y-12698]|uniref:Serine/threonine-protein kinase Tel1 n=1 Tax=Babjeviella inositovora NRRL Y-12698 TaxID=984486 RepID=A0A1E3R1F1_9ASCO|nr:uncharacterized protein BABINDRAFT_6074 [Babjeviella inositovora NRRL Y-12698]ODQ83227.1 hypothetical protein BABINDRAFT_6074 [Babjeviella inositovora NRRL Y-12698]
MSYLITSTLIQSLTSTRVKVRSDALNTLAQLVNAETAHSLSTKALSQLVDALFTNISTEKPLWLKAQTLAASANTLEERIARAAQILRTLLERHARAVLFKLKQILQILDRTMELFFFADDANLDSLELNFSRILLVILGQQFVKDRLTPQHWGTVFTFLTRAILRSLSDGGFNASDRVVNNLFECLSLLINADDAISTSYVALTVSPNYEQLIETTRRFYELRLSRKPEPLVAITTFKIINKLMLVLQTEKVVTGPYFRSLVVLGINLVNLMVEHNNFHSFENLRAQIIVFLNMNPLQFVTGTAPRLLARAPSSIYSDGDTDDDEEEDTDQLVYSCGALISRLIEAETGSTLKVEVSLARKAAPHWFSSATMYLPAGAPTDMTHSWMLYRGTVHLVVSYFRLRNCTAFSLARSQSPKRRRVADEVLGTLALAASPLEFFKNNLLSCNNAYLHDRSCLQRTALLLLAFFLDAHHAPFDAETETENDSNVFATLPLLALPNNLLTAPRLDGDTSVHSIDYTLTQRISPTDLAEILLATFESSGLAYFSLLTSNVLLAHTISNKCLNQLMKAAIQLIKHPDTCVLACLCFCNVLAQPHFSPDKSIVTQLENVVELADVNGPYCVGNEAFHFWYHVYAVSKNRKFHRIVHAHIANWLKRKWTQIIAIHGTSVSSLAELSALVGPHFALPEFIAWLCGGVTPSIIETRELYAGDLNEVFLAFEARAEVRDFILQKDLSVPVSALPFCPEPMAHTSSDVVEDLMMVVIGTGNDYANLFVRTDHSLAVKAVEWCMLILRLCELVEGQQGYEHYVSSIQYQVTMLLEPFNRFTDATISVALIDILRNPRIGNAILQTLFNNLSFQKIYEDASTLQLAVSRTRKNTIRAPNSENECLGEEGSFNPTEPPKVEDFSATTFTALQYREPLSVRIFQFMVRHQTLQKGDYHTRFEHLLGHMKQLSTFDAILCLDALADYITEVGVKNLPLVALDQLIEMIGLRFLNDKIYGLSEIGLVIQLKFMAIVTPAALSGNSVDVKNAFTEVGKWWINNKRQFITEASCHYFAKLLAAMICETKESSHSVGEYFDVLFPLFASSSNQVKVALIADIKGFLPLYSYRQQHYVYTSLYQAFDSPQKSREAAATFCMVMSRLSTTSDLILVHCIYNILEYSSFEYFKPYLPPCIRGICLLQNMNSPKTLFKTYRFDILKVWWSYGLPFKQFPATLLGYEDLNDFVIENYKELVSVMIAHQYPGSNTVLSEMSTICNFPVGDMVFDSLPYTVALAYTTEGLRGGVFETLDRLGLKKSYLKDLLIFIVLEIICMVDLSDEKKLVPVMDKYRVSGLLSSLVRKGSPQLYSSAQVSISVSTTVNLLNEIIVKSCDSNDDFWTVPVAFFLVRRILGLLETSKKKNSQLLQIRRLKFVMILGGIKFSDLNLVNLIITNLSQYLMRESLAEEITDIFMTLFLMNNNTSISSQILLTVASQLVECKFQELKIAPRLKDVVEGAVMALDKADIMTPLLAACVDVLNGYRLRIEISHIEACLCLDRSAVDFTNGRTLIRAISSVFGYASDLASSSHIHRALPQVAKVLFDLDDTVDLLRYSEPFLVWRIRYIGKFYGSSGELIQSQKMEYSPLFDLENSVTNSLSLAIIFEKMISVARGGDLELLSCIETVVGVVLWKHHKNKKEIDELVNYSKVFQAFEAYILPLDFHLCVVLNSDRANNKLIFHNETLATYTTMIEFKFSTLPFDIWTSKLFLALINELSRFTSLAPLISVFVVKVPSFSKSALGYLVAFYIQCTGISGSRIIASMMGKLLDVGTQQLSKEYCRLVLDIGLILRTGRIKEKSLERSRKPFTAATLDMNYPKLYDMAMRLGLPKTGLLLFEDFYRDFSTGTWVENEKILGRIYDAIDEKDLRYGLPIQPTLEYAIDTINYDENTWNQVMVNNSIFDTRIALGASGGDRSSNAMMRSMLSAGFNGISRVLSEYFLDQGESEYGDEAYGWAWKLNQWDVVVPQKVETENKAIYKTLKMIHDYPSSALAACSKTLLDLSIHQSRFYSMSDPRSWLRTVTSVVGIENCLGYTSAVMEDATRDYLAECTWYNSAPIGDYENVILCRRAAFEQMAGFESHGLGREECWVSVVHELVRFGEFSRLNRNLQKAMNSTLMIEKIVKTKFATSGNDTREFMSKLSMYQSAAALWDQNITNIPVAMLQHIRDSGKPFAALDPELPLKAVLGFSPAYINATLVAWTSESKQETPDSIMETLVRPIETMTIADPAEEAKIYHMLAKFCHAQLRDSNLDKRISENEKLVAARDEEILQIREQAKAGRYSAEEKKNIQRYHIKICNQLKSYEDTLSQLRVSKSLFLDKAVESYLKALAIGDDYIDEDVDRFCALWLEYSATEGLSERISGLISKVPTYKFITWATQLTSRLLKDETDFQLLLKRLVCDLALNHPYHVLYLLKSLRLHTEYNEEKNPTVQSRALAADLLWMLLGAANPKFQAAVLNPIDAFCNNCLTLANHKASRAKPLVLSTITAGTWWLESLPAIPPPTMPLAVSKDKDYSRLPFLAQIAPKVTVASSGISLPKIAVFTLSNGEEHRVLLKGGTDDLRQDAIMEQVFEQVNKLFTKDRLTRSRQLHIRTYKVVPLGPKSGVIEFVANSIALNDIVRPLHARSSDLLTFEKARDMMRVCQQQKPQERLKVYEKVESKILPQLRHFFNATFLLPDDWFKSRIVYTKGVATTSILGHILGLGDRHNNNILLDKHTGEPIHIDLGVAFDQGKLLPVPETVPFRLTRDIVDGFGVTGTQGIFRKNCEYVMWVLRQEEERIYGILDVLRWDPLYSWTISPLRQQKLQQEDENDMTHSDILAMPEEDGSVAGRAVAGVKEKLYGNGLSVEATVRELILEAVDPKNLALIYCGWCPFF